MHTLMPHHPVAEARQIERGLHQTEAMVACEVLRGPARNGQEKVRTRGDKSGGRKIRNPYRDMPAMTKGCQGSVDRTCPSTSAMAGRSGLASAAMGNQSIDETLAVDDVRTVPA